MNWTTEITRRIAELDAGDAIGADGQSTVQLDQQSVGRLSRMDALQIQSMAKATQSRRNALRARLQKALERVETGEFGDCAECGEPIPEKRLLLDPSVVLCVTCARG